MDLEAEARTRPRSVIGRWLKRRHHKRRVESATYEEFGLMCVELVRLDPQTLGKVERDVAKEACSKDHLRWTCACMEGRSANALVA